MGRDDELTEGRGDTRHQEKVNKTTSSKADERLHTKSETDRGPQKTWRQTDLSLEETQD